MTNNIKTNLRPYHGSNYDCKYSNSSLNSNNLSLIANVSSSVAQVKRSVKEHASLSISFSVVTPVITHLFDFSNSEKQGFTSHDDKRYYSPTTNCSAVKPNRHSLAIFMSKICLTNYQRFTNDINTNISALQTSHKYSTDTIGANIYDGLSGPNKRPLVGNKPRRLNTVVNNLSPFFWVATN
ncbi:hypothetical protein IQ457_05180 [Psychrobacter sp. M9-54-1]|uniref:hypothetical protein n=1 Tax=Psychrobacter sp. M9-54-1 TaxID=2782386 RepID=UPI0019094D1D|nr:hypothetical protein [Psychrobacter sp. M9-54-1]MBK3393338.1 hypothetical protein [Psychrobacter sp. M9-54-1]